jgi:ribonuclease D
MRAQTFVTIDTEFMRDRTYWPKLCLMQIAGAEEAVAIDPLAPGIDLAPLAALVDDPRVTKVLHASRQDLEIFFRLFGRLPAPLYDTQIAAMVCGFGEEVAYETLGPWSTRSPAASSTRPRASPTGRAGRCPRPSSPMPWATSPICARSTRR